MNTTKVMLADADEEFRVLLSEMINREDDMEVVFSTEDGERAIGFLQNTTDIDVLVMDTVLKNMDGLELLEQINTQEARRP
ncbi:MAG: response regulator, partial [Clostridiales bacterium]|nr:response regulator [Clostridiales bacterium]